MTIHYHGCPISPRSELQQLAGRFFCHSYARPDDIAFCHQHGQGNMLDNGAFTAWRQKSRRRHSWDAWASWAEPWLAYPTTWAVLPDIIDGGAEENDRLLAAWQGRLAVVHPLQLAPVWHLDEPLSRLEGLCDNHPLVCFGSSGQYRVIGTSAWHRRVTEAFDALHASFGRIPWVHMLRGMSLGGSHYPFASLDSTDIGRNHQRPQNTVKRMADRWDAQQCPARWQPAGSQQQLAL